MTCPPLDPLPMNNDDDAIDIDLDLDGDSSSGQEIRTFGSKKAADEKEWSRKTTVTGRGATRLKTFHAKLREDAIEFLDEQVNQWLDEHPEYEVKFVNTTIGELRGKTVEAALFVNVWY